MYDEIELCVKWGYEEVTELGKEINNLVSNNIFHIKLYNTTFRSSQKKKFLTHKLKGRDLQMHKNILIVPKKAKIKCGATRLQPPPPLPPF
jgi:hypothetical protein